MLIVIPGARRVLLRQFVPSRAAGNETTRDVAEADIAQETPPDYAVFAQHDPGGTARCVLRSQGLHPLLAGCRELLFGPT